MKIFVIMMEPEGCSSVNLPAAFKTLEAACKEITRLDKTAEPVGNRMYRNSEYTYYYISEVEVKPDETMA